MADAFDPGKPMTVPEVRHLLEKEREERGELSYEQKLALEHATIFDRIGGVTKARKLYKELVALDRVNDIQALKLVDICPQTPEEVETVFAKDRQPLTDEDCDTIISLISDYV